MERNEVIELGTASLETKGLIGTDPDFAKGQSVPGLSED